MGASESAEPRHVSLEKDDLQIVVTQDVIKRLEGKESNNEPANIESSEGLEKAWSELQEEKRKLHSQRERMQELLQHAYQEGRKIEARKNKENSTTVRDEEAEKKLETLVEEKEKELIEKEKSLKEQLEAVEKKYSDQTRATEEQFNTAVEEVQKKIQAETHCTCLSKYPDKCDGMLHKNPKQPLKCSHQVKEFVECVNQSRLDVLKTTS